MFSKLLASRPARVPSTGGLGASVVLHGLVFAGALSATMTATTTIAGPRVVPIVYMTERSVPTCVTAPPRLSDGVPYRAEEVEVVVAVAKDSPLPRFPSAMSFARINGSTRFQFVVDTVGRVELATVRELESTNEAFAMAVRSELPRMRFTPARAGGRTVRQLVEFPTVFRIER